MCSVKRPNSLNMWLKKLLVKLFAFNHIKYDPMKTHLVYKLYENIWNLYAWTYISAYQVLRIHFILMRIRILEPHWKKLDPDPGHKHFFKIYWFFDRRHFLFFILFLRFLRFRFGFYENENFFSQLFVDIFTLGSGSSKPKSCGYTGS